MDQATVLAVLGSIFHNISAALPAIVPVLYTLVIASLLDLASGSWAALVSGTFQIEFLRAYAKNHIALSVGPIMLGLLAGVSVGGTDSAAGLALIASAGGGAALYLASTVGSIAGNIASGQTKTKGLPSGENQTAVLVEPAEIRSFDPRTGLGHTHKVESGDNGTSPPVWANA